MIRNRMSLVFDLKTKGCKYVSKEVSVDSNERYIQRPIVNPICTLSYRDWRTTYAPELLNIISYITNAIETHDAITNNGVILMIDYKALCEKLTQFIYNTSKNRSKRYYFLK